MHFVQIQTLYKKVRKNEKKKQKFSLSFKYLDKNKWENEINMSKTTQLSRLATISYDLLFSWKSLTRRH